MERLLHANAESERVLGELVRGKNVTFITTKKPDYIRCSQEIRLFREYAENVRVIGSDRDGYPARLAEVYRKIRKTSFDENSGHEVVVVGFAPQLVLPFFHRKFEKCTLIQDFFISCYDTFVQDRQKFRKGSIPAGILHHMDEKTLQYGSLVIADTNADADYFSKEFHRNRGDFLTLYLEADPEIYGTAGRAEAFPEDKKSDVGGQKFDACGESPDAGDSSDSVREYVGSFDGEGNKEKNRNRSFRVLYFGSVLPLQGVDVIMAAVRRVLDDEDAKSSICSSPFQNQIPQLSFEIIGPVPESMKVKDTRVVYIDWLPQKELAEHIAKADLCLAGHFSGTIGKARRTIAGKTFIYRAMGKPIVLGDGSANHELFDEERGEIYYCRMGDPENLAETIIQACRDLTFLHDPE